MTTSTHTAERIVIHNVPWETYLGLVAIADRHSRIAYDEGEMEIMSPLRVHERVGCLIGRMVETWTEVQGIDVVSNSSTTFKRDDSSKGFEADESYYIQNAEAVRHLEEVDLARHPGPDLVIEVDITNSSMRKFGIYASLQVSEVWRWVRDELRIYIHTDESRDLSGFVQVAESRELPGFPIATAVGIIGRYLDERETQLIREFRAIAENLKP